MADMTDFQIGQGETFQVLVHLLDRTNNNIPLDITNYVFSGQLRENYTTEEVAATFEFEKFVPMASGSFLIKIPPEQTKILTQRKYVYDVYANTTIATRRILEGSFTVRPAVTK